MLTDQQIDEFLEMLAKSPTSARDMVRGLFAKAAPAVPQDNDPAWTLAAKVREALDRKACPGYYMDVAVEAVVHNYATAAPSQPAVPQGPVCAALGDIVSMWDQHVPSEHVTPLHMQAKRALAGQQPVSPDMHGWCAYVGGMVAHWVVSEPDAFDRLGPDRFEAAIAGIIERRLWAMPKSATPAAPSQEPVTLTDEVAENAARYVWLRDVHIGDNPEFINLDPHIGGLDGAIDALRGKDGK